MDLRKSSVVRLPRVRIEPSFYLCLSLLFAMRLERDIGAILLLVSLHEAAHMLAILLFHGRVESLCITPFGLRMTSRGGLTASEEAIALFIGPLSNLIAAWALFLASEKALASESLVLGLYNLLPAKGLDGGRLIALLGGRKGESMAAFFTYVLGIFWMAAAFLLAIRQENFLSPLLASWLMLLEVTKEQN